jgi:hypothetical protein
MAAGGTVHEAPEDLAPATRERHRAFASLIEELEAIDWYDQRIDASKDEELKRVLAHNRDEEKEHAAMALEWIRRHDPVFEAHLRAHLFRPGPIEEEAEPGDAKPAAGDGSLGIGSLKGRTDG